MDRSQLRDLHYISHLANVPSILQLGLLSHNRAERLSPTPISDPAVQRRRAGKLVPGGLPLHDYVNLFFDAHNPMLSDIRAQNPDLCVLEVSRDALDISGVVVTDTNAAKEDANFYSATEGLASLNADLVYARFWVSPIFEDSEDQTEARRRPKSAEVLVPNVVEPRFLTGRAFVCSNEAIAKLSGLCPTLNVTVRRYLFFD